MDSFKEMAKDKMREAVSQQIQVKLTLMKGNCAREQEFSSLQATDTCRETPEMDAIDFGTSPCGLWSRRHGPHRLEPGRMASEPPQAAHCVA